MLDEAHKLLPNASWWLKGDGCDVTTSLEESVRKEWNGDVDFGDSSCQQMHQEYLNSLKELTILKGNLFNSSVKQSVIQLLSKLLIQLKEYLNFIHQGD